MTRLEINQVNASEIQAAKNAGRDSAPQLCEHKSGTPVWRALKLRTGDWCSGGESFATREEALVLCDRHEEWRANFKREAAAHAEKNRAIEAAKAAKHGPLPTFGPSGTHVMLTNGRDY